MNIKYLDKIKIYNNCIFMVKINNRKFYFKNIEKAIKKCRVVRKGLFSYCTFSIINRNNKDNKTSYKYEKDYNFTVLDGYNKFRSEMREIKVFISPDKKEIYYESFEVYYNEYHSSVFILDYNFVYGNKNLKFGDIIKNDFYNLNENSYLSYESYKFCKLNESIPIQPIDRDELLGCRFYLCEPVIAPIIYTKHDDKYIDDVYIPNSILEKL